jgi:hypothetical protein
MPAPLTVSPINAAETRLANFAQRGKNPVYGWTPGDPFDQQIVRAGFLRALLCGRVTLPGEAATVQNITAMHLVSTVIVGRLDLAECNSLPYLTFQNCILTDGIVLNNAEAGGIHLRRCFILRYGIEATGLHASGAVELRRVQFAHRSAIDFSQATIGNSCTLSNLSTPGPTAATESLRVKLRQAADNLVANSETASATSNGKPVVFRECISLDQKLASAKSVRELVARAWARGSPARPPAGHPSDFSMISLRAAHIGADLILEGLRVSTCDHPCGSDGLCNKEHGDSKKLAIDAERIEVKGDVTITSSGRQSSILRGGVNFRFAQISGQVNVNGVGFFCCGDDTALNCEGTLIGGHLGISAFDGIASRLRGGLRILGAHIKGQLMFHGAIIVARNAIIGDGVTIDNDLFIRPERDDPRSISVFCGTIRLPGATIGGQFVIQGTRVMAFSRKKSFRPDTRSLRDSDSIPTGRVHGPDPRMCPWDAILETAIAMRDSTVKGGFFIHPFGAVPSCIFGELMMNDCVINGVFDIRGTHMLAGGSDHVIQADGAEIKGEVKLGRVDLDKNADVGYSSCSITGIIRMAGASVGEQFRICDVFLDSRGHASSLIASRSTIDGGFLVATNEGQHKACEIRGALVFDHAQIGYRFSATGARLLASADEECLAISAIGIQIAGDFKVGSNGDNLACEIDGEIRLVGAKITGAFEVESGRLSARADNTPTARATAFAIDGYFANISRGVILSPAPGGPSPSSQDPPVIAIKGIIGFGYATLGSFSLGRSPHLMSQPAGDEGTQPQVIVEGHVRLDGAIISEVTLIAGTRLIAPAGLTTGDHGLASRSIETLKRWGSYDPRTVISMQSANLGTLLTVRLSHCSKGAIDLFNAKVTTLDDQDGRFFGWGKEPVGPGWSGDRWTEPFEGIRLYLKGFTYTHLEEWPTPITGPLLAPLSSMARAALPGQTSRRDWLELQFPNKKPTSQTFTPLPYIHLASVFRSQGLNREADLISLDRRDRHVRYGTLGPLDRGLQGLYGFFFGFGYLSERALATCLLLALINMLFVLVGIGSIPAPRLVAAHQPQPWLVESQDSGKAPLVDLNFSFGDRTAEGAGKPVADSGSAAVPQKNGSKARAIPATAVLKAPCNAQTLRKDEKCPPTSSTTPSPKNDGAIFKQSQPEAKTVACERPWIYSIDQTLPVLHVTSGNSCEVTRDSPRLYRMWQVVMVFLSWIVIPTAALTFSGILRETNK